VTILIAIDMEGISGVVLTSHIMKDEREYQRYRRLMTAETNAAVEGALAGGADRVIVNDGHGGMPNRSIEELNPAAEYICGTLKPHGMIQGIGPDIDAVFLVGYHAMSGAGAAVLEHTWFLRVVEVRLNGTIVGEGGISAAMAGAYGVPVVLVTGDRAVTEEMKTLLGDVETVVVKEGISRYSARCLHPQVARKRIREAAERAARTRGTPLVLDAPVTVSVTFLRASHADMAELLPGSRRVDGRTVEWTGEDMPTVYRAFKAMLSLSADDE